MKKLKNSRRGFLKGAAAGAAAIAVKTPGLRAQQPARRNGAAQPNQRTLAADTSAALPDERQPAIVENPGSDYMVDVIKSLGIEYCASNPGSTFDGLHESLINYGNNSMPEFITCCHEESAVAMAHGYAKTEGKPMMALIHGTVGLTHAGMAIYNAYADRVPIYMVVGYHADAAVRGSGVASLHSANDMGALVRDYTKWDDNPQSLGAFGEAAVRGYKFAMTPPMGPVLIAASHETQTDPNPRKLRVPKLVMTSPPSADQEAIREVAKMMIAAERPLIMSERTVRTPEGRPLLQELAEVLQAPVVSNERMEISNRHPLAGNGGAGYTPDVTLCLEVADVTGTARNNRVRGAKTISISSIDLFHKSNIQDFGHYASDLDLDIGADAQATLPALIEECKKQLTADRKSALMSRGKKIAEGNMAARVRAIEDGSLGWDASPVSLNRLCAELWPLIEKEDWALVSWQGFISGWPGRLWDFTKHYQYLGGQGGGGIGYNAPASVGAALANKKYGRLSINIQCDGDMNYAPGVLWTAAHHKIPLLTIMHNNRGYHAEVMILERRASQRNRGQDRCSIGTKLWEPNINYAKMAEGYGMLGLGPITDPKDLAPAFKAGLERVKKGEPAMIDVVTQPR